MALLWEGPEMQSELNSRWQWCYWQGSDCVTSLTCPFIEWGLCCIQQKLSNFHLNLIRSCNIRSSSESCLLCPNNRTGLPGILWSPRNQVVSWSMGTSPGEGGRSFLKDIWKGHETLPEWVHRLFFFFSRTLLTGGELRKEISCASPDKSHSDCSASVVVYGCPAD